MARTLVESHDPITGERTWIRTDTGEEQPFRSNRVGLPQVRVTIGESLFQEEPALHDKLLNGRAMTWPEISRCADHVLRAVSQDSLRIMFAGASMKEIQRALQTMIQAQKLCSALEPRLNPSASRGAISTGVKSEAQGAIKALLTLPGR